MFEPGGKSVRCQILHESLLSPCMFEPRSNHFAAHHCIMNVFASHVSITQKIKPRSFYCPSPPMPLPNPPGPVDVPAPPAPGI